MIARQPSSEPSRWSSHPATRRRAIALFNMGIGCHGFGVLDKAVPIEHSHGLTADGKTVAPQFEQGDGPAARQAGDSCDPPGIARPERPSHTSPGQSEGAKPRSVRPGFRQTNAPTPEGAKFPRGDQSHTPADCDETNAS